MRPVCTKNNVDYSKIDLLEPRKSRGEFNLPLKTTVLTEKDCGGESVTLDKTSLKEDDQTFSDVWKTCSKMQS